MPIKYDLTKDIRFKEGLKTKARASAIRMLKNGSLSVVTIAEVLDVPLDFVLKIQKELEKNPDLK